MITSKKCSDCIKENVCKYRQEHINDKTKLNELKLSAVTNIHIECTEFVGKPTMREWGND